MTPILTRPRVNPMLEKAIVDLFSGELGDLIQAADPRVFGAERGFNQAADNMLLTQTKDGADLNSMWREFQQAVRMANENPNRLVQLLTFKVSNPVERVMYPTQEDFEEASEFGEPKGIRQGKPFSMGYDFRWFDLAIRYTWMFLVDATADELRALTNQAISASQRLVWTRVMRALFNPANRVANIEGTNQNVYALYNADGTVPPPYKTSTFLSTHTHYLASGAATVDSGDLADIEEHLYHHGYRMTLGYQLVLMVNRQEANVIRGATAPAQGGTWKYTFIPNENTGGGVLLDQNGGIIGRPTLANIPGAIGTYGPFTVVEEEYIPAGYVLGFATGGEQNLGNLVGIREHENSGLRGMQLVKGADNDYPLTDSFYRQGLGTGIRHRGAGVIVQITTNPSYAAPAAYA
jgi:hypothetical protein